MTIDLARFRERDVFTVYGDYPLCLITTANRDVDISHILGRGYVHGANLKSDDRLRFSSVFNAAPLCRAVHAGPMRDAPEMRHLLLRLARQNVMNAVALGSYELTEIDTDFAAFSAKWRSENPFA